MHPVSWSLYIFMLLPHGLYLFLQLNTIFDFFSLRQYFLIVVCDLFHAASWRVLTKTAYLSWFSFLNWDSRHYCNQCEFTTSRMLMDGKKYTHWLIRSQTITIEWIAEELAIQWTSLVTHSDVWRKWIAKACGAECWEKHCTFKMLKLHRSDGTPHWLLF